MAPSAKTTLRGGGAGEETSSGGIGASSSWPITVIQDRPPRVPTTTCGTTSTLSPGSSAKAKLARQTRPLPGSSTSSRTTADAVTARHQSAASEKRSAPSVRHWAATPQATMPSPRRSQAIGSAAGSRSIRVAGREAGATSTVRATRRPGGASALTLVTPTRVRVGPMTTGWVGQLQ